MHRPRPIICVLDDELRFFRAPARLLKTHGLDLATFTDGGNCRGLGVAGVQLRAAWFCTR